MPKNSSLVPTEVGAYVIMLDVCPDVSLIVCLDVTEVSLIQCTNKR